MGKLILIAITATTLIACTQESDTSTRPANPTHMVQEMEISNYAPRGWLGKSLPDIAEALQSGELTSVELVHAYIDRIAAVDRAGPMLQSVLTINPDVLALAKGADARLAAGDPIGPLHGVPILLKDNIETKDQMPTTAGSLSLKDNITGRDSPLVAGLREAGAIILGKTNLSQWANFRSNDSLSGWSSLGGQVRNPHMLDRNPCGSSSGSGAATAASLAAGTVGTETNGSIICPAHSNGVVGFKPTVGLVSQQYIIPISFSQDTAGPMTKTVKGAAMMLSAMATGTARTDYVAALDKNIIQGKRIGVLRYAAGYNKDIVEKFDAALTTLKGSGAHLIEIDKEPNQVKGFRGYAFKVLLYEFKATINAYLADTPAAVQSRSLDDLISFNKQHANIELALFNQSIFDAAQALGDLDSPEYIEALNLIQTDTREKGIDLIKEEHQVEILVAPSGSLASRVDPINGDLWPSFPGAGSMVAIAGYPHLTVPMGTVHNLSLGLSFIGAKNDDAKVLAYGYAFEQQTHLCAEPQYLNRAEEIPAIGAAMSTWGK